MMTDQDRALLQRPTILDFEDPRDYVGAMINYLKKTQANFSVRKEAQNFRKLSPALITLLVQKKRSFNSDRVDEISKLLKLSASEKHALKKWVSECSDIKQQNPIKVDSIRNKRKQASLSLLNDWVNVYVKDCFQIESIRKNPELVFAHLSHIANKKRIEKSLQFLTREGYLRKNLEGNIVLETDLVIAETPVPSEKVRSFHKAALKIAQDSLELIPIHQRFVNTLIMPMNEKRYGEFLEIIQEFSEKIKDFAADSEKHADKQDKLYQFNLNLCPTGRGN